MSLAEKLYKPLGFSFTLRYRFFQNKVAIRCKLYFLVIRIFIPLITLGRVTAARQISHAVLTATTQIDRAVLTASIRKQDIWKNPNKALSENTLEAYNTCKSTCKRTSASTRTFTRLCARRADMHAHNICAHLAP